MSITELDQALEYAQSLRWSLFPTRLVRRTDGKLDKIPCIKDWPNAASRDPVQIKAWWRQWSDAAISIPTGALTGVIILDVDVRDDRNGFDTLAELGRSILPETPISHTPSGGVHIWFVRGDEPIRNSAGTKGLGVGLDIRGDGGQVVIPSPHSGYWWDPHNNFDTVAPVPAPAWLGHRTPKIRSPIRAGHSAAGRSFDPQAILAECCRRIEQAPKGERHDTYRQEVFRVATMVRDGLLSEADAHHALKPVVMALGMRADGHLDRVEKYYNLAFDEGLSAPSVRRSR